MDEATNIGQDKAELDKMAAYYKDLHTDVWFVHCLQCERVIAVEVSPALPSQANGPRNRLIFGYQGLFLTVRQRLDSNGQGGYMIGYECRCGNDTRLGATEKGVVPEQNILIDKEGRVVQSDPPLVALSPYERAQMQEAVNLNLSISESAPDYEVSYNQERFETFMVERV